MSVFSSSLDAGTPAYKHTGRWLCRAVHLDCILRLPQADSQGEPADSESDGGVRCPAALPILFDERRHPVQERKALPVQPYGK